MDIKQLPKMDAGMLQKADLFLQDERAISTRTGLRLMIEMMVEEYRALDAIIDNQNAIVNSFNNQQREIDTLKRKSIIMFIENHPKLSLLASLIAFLLLNFVPLTYIRKAVFAKIGIPDPLP